MFLPLTFLMEKIKNTINFEPTIVRKRKSITIEISYKTERINSFDI